MTARMMDYSYLALTDLEVITGDELQTIENNARMLNLVECMEYLCIDYEQLPELEKEYCIHAWKRGRAMGIRSASDKMFSHMSSRSGGTTAIEYLRSMSGEFSVDVLPTPGGSSSSGFTFNVNMNSSGMKPALPTEDVTTVSATDTALDEAS